VETTRFEPGRFRNIDLEVKSRRSLTPLATAWPWAQLPSKLEGEPRWLQINPRRYTKQSEHAEGTAKQLLRHIESLRGEALRCWKGAHERVFDIGVQAPGPDPRRAFEEVQFSAETLRRIAAAGARIKVTVYPAEPECPPYIPPKRKASKRR
jgi:hypothetical protein